MKIMIASNGHTIIVIKSQINGENVHKKKNKLFYILIKLKKIF